MPDLTTFILIKEIDIYANDKHDQQNAYIDKTINMIYNDEICEKKLLSDVQTVQRQICMNNHIVGSGTTQFALMKQCVSLTHQWTV